MTTTQDKKGPQDQNEQGFFCVGDVLHSPAPLNATVGDIFVTTKGLYYICYRDFIHSGSLGGLAATVLGGVTGGIAIAMGDKMQVEAALETAAAERTEQLGLNMSERLSKNRRSIFIPRDAITRLEADIRSKKIRVVYRDATVEFFASVSEHLANEFRAYVAGTAIPSGIHGLDVTFPEPRDFLNSFVGGGDVGIGPSFFRAMSTNRRFLFDLFIAFTKLQESDKAPVCQGLAAQGSFSSALASVISTDVRRQKRKAFFGAVGFSLGVVFFLGMALIGLSVGESSKGKANDLGVIIIFTVIGLPCLYYAIDGFRKVRTYSKHSRLLLPALRKA